MTAVEHTKSEVTARTPAGVFAAFLADVRELLEPQARAELAERRKFVEQAAKLAESGVASARAKYTPLAERLAVLESRIADAKHEHVIPDIESCTTAEYLEAMRREAERRIALPVLTARHSDITNESTPLVMDIRQAENRADAEKRALADYDAAIADPFGTDLGLKTEAGRQWMTYGLGLGATPAEPAPSAEPISPKDRRIRRRNDGTVLAVVNPREVTPEVAAHTPSAHPNWGTTAAPAGNAETPDRIPAGHELRTGIPGAGQ